MKNDMAHRKKPVLNDLPKISPEQRAREIKALVSGNYPEEAVAIVGENRGQCFVRIPKSVSKLLGLKKEDKLLLRAYRNQTISMEVEVIRDATS